MAKARRRRTSAPNKPASPTRSSSKVTKRSKTPQPHPPLRRSARLLAAAILKQEALVNAPSTTTTNFWNLFPELRNKIYEFALVQDEEIRISPANYSTHQPPLLKTCRLIRKEAIAIFYGKKNNFVVRPTEWKGRLVAHMFRLMTRYGNANATANGNANVTVLPPKPNEMMRGDLAIWLYSFWIGKNLPLSLPPDFAASKFANGHDIAIDGLFKLVASPEKSLHEFDSMAHDRIMKSLGEWWRAKPGYPFLVHEDK